LGNSKKESAHDDAARLLRRYAKKLPKLTAERRRRIVSAVASDLESKHSARPKKVA
jgi:hypothetical protein